MGGKSRKARQHAQRSGSDPRVACSTSLIFSDEIADSFVRSAPAETGISHKYLRIVCARSRSDLSPDAANWTASIRMADKTTFILAGALTHQNCYR